MAPHRHCPDEEGQTRHQRVQACNGSPLEEVMEAAVAAGTGLDLAALPLDLRKVIRVARGSVDGLPGPEDDDLTSLSWLQDSNLLKSLHVGGAGNGVGPPRSAQVGNESDNSSSPPSSEYLDDGSDLGAAVDAACGVLHVTGHKHNHHNHHHPPSVPYNPQVHVNAKPPYSFSCLIFMAVEDAPGKALPVKDIYSWILTHFPYFQNAPTGWKNSVRHNLSLNKCFRKVDKEKGQNIGKGSLWCIDPDYRPNLLQALRKTPCHPYHHLQMLTSQTAANTQNQKPVPLAPKVNINVPNPDLFPYLSKRLAASNAKPDPEADAAATMLALKNGPRLSTPGIDADHCVRIGNGAVIEEKLRKRLETQLRTSTPGYHERRRTRREPVITCSPSEDHTYSSTSSPEANPQDESLTSEGDVTELSKPQDELDYLSDGFVDVNEDDISSGISSCNEDVDDGFDSLDELNEEHNGCAGNPHTGSNNPDPEVGSDREEIRREEAENVENVQDRGNRPAPRTRATRRLLSSKKKQYVAIKNFAGNAPIECPKTKQSLSGSVSPLLECQDEDDERKKIEEGVDALLNLAGIKMGVAVGKRTRSSLAPATYLSSSLESSLPMRKRRRIRNAGSDYRNKDSQSDSAQR